MKKAIYLFLCFIGCQCVCGALVYILLSVMRQSGAHVATDFEAQAVLLGCIQLLGDVILVSVLLALGLVRRRFLPPSKISRQRLMHGGTALLAFMCVALGLSVLLSPLELSDNGQMRLFEAMTRSIPCLLLLVVVGPLVEELVFREGIIRQLVSGGCSPIAAAAISALLFAIVHGNLAQGIPAFCVGFVFGLYYLHTGNLWLCGTLHIINNGVSVLLMHFPETEQYVAQLPLGLQMSVGGAMILIGGYAVWRQYAARHMTRAALQ